MTAASSAKASSVGADVGEGRLDRSAVEVDREEDFVGHRPAQFLGELTDEARRTGRNREGAQQPQRQTEAGQRGASRARLHHATLDSRVPHAR